MNAIRKINVSIKFAQYDEAFNDCPNNSINTIDLQEAPKNSVNIFISYLDE